ncbi:MAG: hypothetical protein LIO44_01570 [Eubacterium sp.]|nr:hypothetical protein [Eubacterium sp.]
MIFLTFLKILGYVIIIIIAAAVLVIGTLLSAPFYLRAKGDINDKSEGEFTLRWLFGLVRLKGRFRGGKLDYSLSYPFKSVLSRPKKKKAQKAEKKPSKTVNKQSPKQAAPKPQTVSPDKEKKENTNKTVNTKSTEKTKKEKQTGQTGQKPKSRISVLRERISEIMAYENKGDIINCFVKNIKYMLCKLKFKAFEVNVLFGFEDPSLTGEVLGLLYASGIALIKGINVNAYFNKQKFEAERNIKCRGNLFNIVFPAARFILNKNVRSILF